MFFLLLSRHTYRVLLGSLTVSPLTYRRGDRQTVTDTATPFLLRDLDSGVANSIPSAPISMNSLSRTGRGRIDGQCDVRAECRPQALDCAILSAAWEAADAYSADHLAVNNDRDAACDLE